VTSLAGDVVSDDLKPGGADPRNPGSYIDIQARAEGPIFLNPTLTLNPKAAVNDRSISRSSRRQGVILDVACRWGISRWYSDFGRRSGR